MDSLCCAIKNELKLDLHSAEAVLVAQETISYLCGVTNAYHFQDVLKKAVNFSDLPISAKDFRLALVKFSYFTLNLKFFSLNLIKFKVSKESIHANLEAFDVVRNDAVMVRKALKTHSFRRNMRKTDRIQEIEPADITEDAVDAAQEAFHEMYPELMKHVRAKTYKKLRFLVTSENTEFSDFNGDLLYKAVKAYYMMIPTKKPRAHVLNYLRSTCTNHALNIISAQTSDKRRRLTNVGADGFGGNTFSLTCVSENQLITSENGESLSYESTLNDVNANDSRSLLAELNYERVVNRHGTSPRRRRIISIVSGQDDLRFTRYLEARDYIRPGEDCTDFVARNKHENVMALLSDHLGVQQRALTSFLRRVGLELIRHRSVA